ncbi:sigma-70 family RNA polymerase sigma factor [Pseudomonas sp. ODNR1LW]|nr:sigma-70 family RNA polymerase sigma factor [Pseudomonas sp. ODNR1LW]
MQINLTQALIMHSLSYRAINQQDITSLSNRPIASDQELYEAMRAGDDLCLRTLMERHRGMAHAVCRNILGDEVEADDVVQEVFFSLWKRGGWTPGDVRFTTWLHRVLINRSIDHRRRRRDTPTEADVLSHAVEDFGETGPDAEELITRQETADRLRAALLRLPTAQQRVLNLHYFEDADVPEIMARLAATENSVRSLLKRGKMALREDLRKQKKIWTHDLDRTARHA